MEFILNINVLFATRQNEIFYTRKTRWGIICFWWIGWSWCGVDRHTICLVYFISLLWLVVSITKWKRSKFTNLFGFCRLSETFFALYQISWSFFRLNKNSIKPMQIYLKCIYSFWKPYKLLIRFKELFS